MTGIPELLVYLNYVCLRIEYNNDCYRDIRRTLNSTPGPSQPRTRHISWYKTSIPKMWTDLGKTKEKLRCTVIKYRLHRRIGCCMLPCYRSPGKKIIFGGSIFPASAFEADVITTTLRKPHCFKLWYLIVISAFLTVSCNVKTVRHLAIGSCVIVRMSRSEALGTFEEHERGVRVGRGATLPS